MARIVVLTQNDNTTSRLQTALDAKIYDYCIVQTMHDLIKISDIDVCIIDSDAIDNFTILKNIKSRYENIQIIMYCLCSDITQDYSGVINSYIFEFYDTNLIRAIVNTSLKAKSNFDKFIEKNKNLANSLYRLNVLYNTSSQIAGTLDSNALINYMIEGLDRSLGFDLACTLSLEVEDQPTLIINSLYDISDELMEELKLRAVKNLRGLFNDSDCPYVVNAEDLTIIKHIKNSYKKLSFSILEYDNLFAAIDSENKFFGCIEVFKEKSFSTDDAAFFQTIIKQVSLPLKSAVLYNQIMEKNNQLEKLQRIKSEFISIVSHELRTPLTPVKNALVILSSGRCGELSESANKFIDMAKRNVDNLTNIINDILDINKIEAGKMDFNYEIMNIKTVIDSVKTSFDLVAKEKGIIFNANISENLPEIFADAQRIGQVLTNLVSNAMKFTESGKQVTIKTQLIDANSISYNKYFENEFKNLSGNYIMVSVIDEGIGIHESNLLKVFDKFTQIENSLSRKVGGTGLGLPIAKQLINAHKGIIWCDSVENRGSSFNFILPVCTIKERCKTIQKSLI